MPLYHMAGRQLLFNLYRSKSRLLPCETRNDVYDVPERSCSGPFTLEVQQIKSEQTNSDYYTPMTGQLRLTIV